jgi:benzoyl-CoA reductase/2-hydroxyglutaryl-CoA dehydratase subunit BcrC/BadD/HgdB
MKKIIELRKVVSNPYAYIRKYKKQSGKKVVGYFCSYAPEELIWAAGALPLRMFGTSENIHLADTHLQAYCCSLVRGILEEALANRLDFLMELSFRTRAIPSSDSRTSGDSTFPVSFISMLSCR